MRRWNPVTLAATGTGTQNGIAHISPSRTPVPKLLHRNPRMFRRYQPLKNRQNPLSVLINTIQVRLESPLEVLRPKPLIDYWRGYVDILPQRMKRMPAQE